MVIWSNDNVNVKMTMLMLKWHSQEMGAEQITWMVQTCY